MKSEKARFAQSVFNTVFYVIAAIVFGSCIAVTRGQQAAIEFAVAYLVEQSLSVDNLFVFLMLFQYFQVPLEHQGRVLTWGIFGAVAMRGVMIIAGVAAVQRFRSVILIFAAILLVSAVKLFFETDEAEELSNNLILRISKRAVGAVDQYDGENFFTQVDGRTRATPLLLCLVCIELSDFVFAVDSIPAVIGVSQDLLVVYSSNIFAIMGLRSLYTLLVHALHDLPYLRPAVALVLAFIGLKMILEFFHTPISIGLSLAVVATLLSGGVLLSIISNRRNKTKMEPPDTGEATDASAVSIQRWPSFPRPRTF
jgi:tellurite resistance protein TerC